MIKPVIDRDAIHLENVREFFDGIALIAQQHTLGTLSHTVMLTFLVYLL